LETKKRGNIREGDRENKEKKKNQPDSRKRRRKKKPSQKEDDSSKRLPSLETLAHLFCYFPFQFSLGFA
jgi:hypothetical protein